MTETFKIFQVDTKEAEKINAPVNEAHHHDFEELIIGTEGQASLLAIPTPEHYLPLLYTLSLKDKSEEFRIFNDNIVGGSLSMTSVKIA